MGTTQAGEREEGDSELLATDSEEEDVVVVTQEDEEAYDIEMAETIDGIRAGGDERGALFETLRAKMRANKTWVGRWIDRDLKSCLSMLDRQGPSAAKQVGKAHQVLEKLEDKMETIEDQLDEMAQMVPQVRDDADRIKNEVHLQITRARNDALNKIATYEAGQMAQAARPAVPAAGDGAARRQKVDDSLRPAQLTPEFTPAEFDSWKRDFTTYFNANRLGDVGVQIEEQRLRLDQCLNPHFKRWLGRERDTTTAILGAGGCLAALEDEFKRLYPMFARRKQFWSMTPDKGEDFKSFRMRLREVGDMCDLSNLTEEQCYIIKYQTTVNDEGLKQQLIANVNRNLRTLDATIDAYFAAKAGERQASEGARVWKAQDGQRGRGGREHRQRSKSPGSKPRGACFGCGVENHIRRECNFKNNKCSSCGNVGHLPRHSTCPNNKGYRKPNRSQTPGPRAAKMEEGAESTGMYQAWPPMMPPTPQGGESANMIRMASQEPKSYAQALEGGKNRIYIYRKPVDLPIIDSEIITDHEALVHPTFQDTGASANVISHNLFLKWNLKLLEGYTKPMYSVTGERMSVEGRTSLSIRSREGFEFKSIELVVTKDTADEVIIGLKDIRRTGLLPPNWPHQIGYWSNDRCNRVDSVQAECDEVKNRLCEEFSDVISDEISMEKIVGEPLNIKFKKGVAVRPYKHTTARRIPIHQEKAAHEYLGDLMRKGIIEKIDDDEPCDFVAPAFFVPKANGKVRLVTDYKYINQFLDRPVQPFMSSRQIVDAIRPESKYFGALDMVQGYYQIALDHESSKLTTFILPDGKYRYKRLPMGMNIAGDVWNIRTDGVICGVKDALKMIDDVLTQGITLTDTEEKLRKVLLKCRELGITVSRSKFRIGQEVEFVGYKIGADGVRPSSKNLDSVRNFPVPKCVKDIRAFMGLANQISHFSPDLMQNTVHLRALLKRENAFIWGEAQENDFKRAKEILLSDAVVKPYMMGLRTVLYTDASKLHGLGFALVQYDKESEKPRLVTCGSCALTPTQSRYAVCELEALGIQYALEKCNHYLRGAPKFTIVTDHRPLVGIWTMELAAITNPRLLRLRLKTVPYDFELIWQPGKKQLVADALSRYPTFAPEAGCKELDEAHIYICRAITTQTPCRTLLEAAQDSEYMKIVECVEKEEWSEIQEGHPAWELRKWGPSMSILKGETGGALVLVGGERILVPQSARKAILDILHEGHPGVTKMVKKANCYYFWPGMNNECELKVKGCMECVKLAPSQQKHKLTAEKAMAPMSHMGIDLFSWQGKNYLVAVCRFSGWPFVKLMRSTTTDSVCKTLTSWFNNFGWPIAIRTDGGPQFRAIFSEFCASRNIAHETASAYNAEANGLAEAAVKQTKYLLQKIGSMGERYDRELCAWRNTPRADGFSPAMLMFNRNMKEERLPVAAPALRLQSQGHQELGAQARQEVREQQVGHKNQVRLERKQLQVGQLVLVQNTDNNLWDQFGTIIEVRPDNLSYLVRLHNNDRIVLRGRDLLKDVHPELEQQIKTITLQSILLPPRFSRAVKKAVRWGSSTPTTIRRLTRSTIMPTTPTPTTGWSTWKGDLQPWPSCWSPPSLGYQLGSVCGAGLRKTESGSGPSTPTPTQPTRPSGKRTSASWLGEAPGDQGAPRSTTLPASSGAAQGPWSTSPLPQHTPGTGRDPTKSETPSGRPRSLVPTGRFRVNREASPGPEVHRKRGQPKAPAPGPSRDLFQPHLVTATAPGVSAAAVIDLQGAVAELKSLMEGLKSKPANTARREIRVDASPLRIDDINIEEFEE